MAWSRAAIDDLYARPAGAGEVGDRDRCEAARIRLATSGELVGNVRDEPGAAPSIPVAEESARASSPAQNALFLYRLVRALRPEKVVEFGSAVGVSGSYLASALRANGTGRLITVEGSASRQTIAARTIETVAPGVTTSLCSFFDDAVDSLDGADLFFIDGNHFFEPTMRYVGEAVSRMRRPALLVLDDIATHSETMDQAWTALRADPRFAYSHQVARIGLLALGKPAWPHLPAATWRTRVRRLRQRPVA